MYHDLLASSTKPRVPAVSRNWQSVSKDIQKLAAGVLVVKNEGMFPYETHYVLATDDEVERLVSLHSVAGVDAKKADGRRQTKQAVHRPETGSRCPRLESRPAR
jgi:hypothetical protein